MTQQQQPIKWNELTPRERDILVAEKVMGWENCSYKISQMLNLGVWVGTTPDGLRASIPNYTTSIEDAWAVLDNKRFESFDLFSEYRDDHRSYHVRCHTKDRGWVSVSTNSAPEAICIAALRAVGCEVVTE